MQNGVAILSVFNKYVTEMQVNREGNLSKGVCQYNFRKYCSPEDCLSINISVRR